MKKIPKISEAEWEVMKVIWDHPSLPASEVAERLSAQKDWSPRTVKTLLARLVRKRALAFKSDGVRYLYEPKVRKEDLVERESRTFLNRVFDGVTTPMLVHFVKNTKLSREEIQELKLILTEKEKKQ